MIPLADETSRSRESLRGPFPLPLPCPFVWPGHCGISDRARDEGSPNPNKKTPNPPRDPEALVEGPSPSAGPPSPRPPKRSKVARHGGAVADRVRARRARPRRRSRGRSTRLSSPRTLTPSHPHTLTPSHPHSAPRRRAPHDARGRRAIAPESPNKSRRRAGADEQLPRSPDRPELPRVADRAVARPHSGLVLGTGETAPERPASASGSGSGSGRERGAAPCRILAFSDRCGLDIGTDIDISVRESCGTGSRGRIPRTSRLLGEGRRGIRGLPSSPLPLPLHYHSITTPLPLHCPSIADPRDRPMPSIPGALAGDEHYCRRSGSVPGGLMRRVVEQPGAVDLDMSPTSVPMAMATPTPSPIPVSLPLPLPTAERAGGAPWRGVSIYHIGAKAPTPPPPPAQEPWPANTTIAVIPSTHYANSTPCSARTVLPFGMVLVASEVSRPQSRRGYPALPSGSPPIEPRQLE
ncbi:hypothetical protein JHW43_003226 [Diplocarpon mali]|nr:hypothetical protein JHW43_003226 [Diplocarpon mali]